MLNKSSGAMICSAAVQGGRRRGPAIRGWFRDGSDVGGLAANQGVFGFYFSLTRPWLSHLRQGCALHLQQKTSRGRCFLQFSSNYLNLVGFGWIASPNELRWNFFKIAAISASRPSCDGICQRTTGKITLATFRHILPDRRWQEPEEAVPTNG